MNIKNLEYKTITPEYAKYLLGKNYENNRNIRFSEVVKYARDMKNGKWISNPHGNQIAPICISKSGKLLDGQHRLNAIIQAGVPVKMFIQTGLEENAFEKMDNGIKRTTADVIGEEKNAKTLSALVKCVFPTKYGNAPLLSCLQGTITHTKPQVRTTRQDILTELKNEDADIYRECATYGMAMATSIGKGGASIYAYFAWLCKWLERDEYLDEFIRDMSSNKPAKCINVEIVKRAILSGYIRHNDQKGSRLSPSDLLGILLRGYEATRNNRELERFSGSKKAIELYSSLIDAKREETR